MTQGTVSDLNAERDKRTARSALYSPGGSPIGTGAGTGVGVGNSPSSASILTPRIRNIKGLHPIGLFVLLQLQSMAGPLSPVEMVWGMDERQHETFRYRFCLGNKHWDKVISYAELEAQPVKDKFTPEWGATWRQTLGRWMREAAEHLGGRTQYPGT